MILDQQRMQTGRGETISDTAKVLSRYLHGLVIRTYAHQIVEEFAQEGSVPVVNALTDALHPCQIVSDLFTLAERWGSPGKLLESLRGRKLVFFGDCASNMAHSWILGGALAGMKIVLCGPEGYAPNRFVDDLLEEAGLPKSYVFTTDCEEATAGADALYTDVWVSMGDEEERDKRLRELQPYQVNASIMKLAKPDAFFLHCLPAHEGEEVSSDVYKGPQSIVFDEAENRLHAQKAILSLLSGTPTD
jgi:ornithine carbamoyltransferase